MKDEYDLKNQMSDLYAENNALEVEIALLKQEIMELQKNN